MKEDVIIHLTEYVFNQIKTNVNKKIFTNNKMENLTEILEESINSNLPFNRFKIRLPVSCFESRENLMRLSMKEAGINEIKDQKKLDKLNHFIDKYMSTGYYDFQYSKNVLTNILTFSMYIKHYTREEVYDVVFKSEFDLNLEIDKIFSNINVITNKLIQDSENNEFKLNLIAVEILYGVLRYLNSPRTAAPKTEKIKVNNIQKKNKNNKRNNITYINKITYSMNTYDEEHIVRHYEKKAESWVVRGHYRHYKTGKVIWVESHIKGNGTADNKEYKITEVMEG